MKKLIRKILREEIEKSDRHYRRLDIISDYVELPYFKSMEGLTIYDEDDQEYIMRNILGFAVYKRYNGLYKKDDNTEIYYENSRGQWRLSEFNDNGNETYYQNSNGWWFKQEFDDNGNMLYYENSNGDIRDYRHLRFLR
tara:strand:+ start:128 stop:544 length:417 start_codon:yes stop_codon:yes gene_type:complete